jgi:hypothetical protein
MASGWGGAALPAPLQPTIYEPFAGSAGYALAHHDRNVVLNELYPVIWGIWDYLLRVESAEVLRLPLKVECTDDLKECEEARNLIGFWLNKGAARPSKRPSPRMSKPSWQHRPKSHWGVEMRDRIASQVSAIKHWRLLKRGSYDRCPDVKATWFIDPPYQTKGTSYKFGSGLLNFDRLGAWCLSRGGQVIVCENAGATWLPFKPFRQAKSTHHGGHNKSIEVLWVRSK